MTKEAEDDVGRDFQARQVEDVVPIEKNGLSASGGDLALARDTRSRSGMTEEKMAGMTHNRCDEIV